MATRRHKGKRVTIQVDDSLARHVDRLMRTTYRSITERLEREVADVHNQAVPHFPVRTGSMRRSLKYDVKFQPPNLIVGRVYMDPNMTLAVTKKGKVAPYGYLVRAKGQTKGTVWSVRVVRPGRAAARRRKLLADMQADLVSAANG